MIADLRTMLWKELREIPLRRRGGLLSLMVLVGLIGVVLPLEAGLRFLQAGQQVAQVALPMWLIMALVADSFAGERERHTLETLLASPLSDRTILFGKVAAAMAFGWGISLLSLLLGLVMVNLKYRQGKLLLPSAHVAVGVVLLSLTAGLLVASVGVLVSLRASTVRQAQQALSMSLLAAVFAGIFGFRSLPREWLAWLNRAVATSGEMTVIFTGVALLFLIDLAILGAALARFRRSRLILD